MENIEQMSKRLRFWSAAARRTASRLLDDQISPGATCRARPKRRRAAALQTGGCRLEGGIDYIYDGKRVIQERDTNNTPTVSYTRGNDLSGSLEGAGGIGGLLERADGYNPTNGSWANHNYYHADGNGNVTYLESDSQTLAASYRYDAYGNTLASSGTLAVSNTYRFSSKEFIPAAGLYYYLYRFYDPALQRWLNRDPIAERGGINLYGFVGNSSANAFDGEGTCFIYNLIPIIRTTILIHTVVNPQSPPFAPNPPTPSPPLQVPVQAPSPGPPGGTPPEEPTFYDPNPKGWPQIPPETTPPASTNPGWWESILTGISEIGAIAITVVDPLWGTLMPTTTINDPNHPPET